MIRDPKPVVGAGDSIAIRAARDADAEGVIALVARCFDQYPGCVMDLPGLDADLPRVATAYRRAGGQFWIAETGGEIVASVGFVPKAGGVIELKRLYVCPNRWRTGLGTRLLRLVLDAARQQCARAVELWSDTRFREAHAFYRAHGFVRTGETRELHDPSNTTEYFFRHEIQSNGEAYS